MKNGFFLTALCVLLSICNTKGQQTIKGKASYYSDALHGLTTSNGEIYHRDSMTCAHKTFPFGTILLVKNLRNNKEVIVRVTDRGPFSKRYIIDLSRAAAKKLDFIYEGFCPVEITQIHPIEIPFRAYDKEQMPFLHFEYQEIITNPSIIWDEEIDLSEKEPEKIKFYERYDKYEKWSRKN